MRVLSIVYPVLVYYVAGSMCKLLFVYFMQWISLHDGAWSSFAAVLQENSVITSAVVSGMSMLFGAACVFPLLKKEKICLKMTKEQKKDLPFLFLTGAFTALFFNILFSLLQITESSQRYAEVSQRQFSLPIWAGLILYGVIAPLSEETVFRGLVYNGIHRNYGKIVAVIGSALIFGLYHGNMVQALYGFILGVFIAVFYEHYGSFIVPLLLHGAANSCVYVVSTNTLLQSKVIHPLVCIVCGICAAALIWWLTKKKEYVR